MAYTKTDWKDGTTPIDATNMNKIEDGIAANADDISSLNDDLANMMRNVSSFQNLLSIVQSANTNDVFLLSLDSSVTSALTNARSTRATKCVLYVASMSASYLLFSAAGAFIYVGQIDFDGNLQYSSYTTLTTQTLSAKEDS